MNSNGELQSQKTEKIKDHDDDESVVRELPYPFEKELINRQNQFIRPYEKFIPIFHASSKCENFNKFYARPHQDIPSPQSIRKYMAFIERKNCDGYLYVPHLESVSYGWLPSHVNKMATLEMLNSIIAPKRRCCLTVFNEKLHSERVTEREVFNGPRFNVH